MERFFRGLKPEWALQIGYTSFIEAKASVTDYIIGYYKSGKASPSQRWFSTKCGREKLQG